ncbi:hypothetical protein EDB87DRAFT_1292874 [Lactarius vividus]|nr:hypothetical protein EDB87DRAFT_1292874 [Lactarius vividus]
MNLSRPFVIQFIYVLAYMLSSYVIVKIWIVTCIDSFPSSDPKDHRYLYIDSKSTTNTLPSRSPSTPFIPSISHHSHRIFFIEDALSQGLVNNLSCTRIFLGYSGQSCFFLPPTCAISGTSTAVSPMLRSRAVIRVACHLKIDHARVYFCDLAIGAPPVLDPGVLEYITKRIRTRLCSCYFFLQKCPMSGPRYSSWRVSG